MIELKRHSSQLFTVKFRWCYSSMIYLSGDQSTGTIAKSEESVFHLPAVWQSG
jgi:hypothetical protein